MPQSVLQVDAFTDNIGKIAVPTAASGARFQQALSGMNVTSNDEAIRCGTGFEGHIASERPTSKPRGNRRRSVDAQRNRIDAGRSQIEECFG